MVQQQKQACEWQERVCFPLYFLSYLSFNPLQLVDFRTFFALLLGAGLTQRSFFLLVQPAPLIFATGGNGSYTNFCKP